jgi:hypothetical protein
MCDFCEELEASTFCQVDRAHFCSKCDLSCHNNKITTRHKRTPVGEVYYKLIYRDRTHLESVDFILKKVLNIFARNVSLLFSLY